jgi:hypothetical protein
MSGPEMPDVSARQRWRVGDLRDRARIAPAMKARLSLLIAPIALVVAVVHDSPTRAASITLTPVSSLTRAATNLSESYTPGFGVVSTEQVLGRITNSGLVKFDLASIAANAPIVSATFRFDVDSLQGDGAQPFPMAIPGLLLDSTAASEWDFSTSPFNSARISVAGPLDSTITEALDETRLVNSSLTAGRVVGFLVAPSGVGGAMLSNPTLIIETASVPEPSSLFAIGSGLAGYLLYRRRRENRIGA